MGLRLRVGQRRLARKLAALARQDSKCAILVGLHDLTLARALVVDAAKVQDAMDDGAMQLLVVRLAELLGVGAHGVEANEEVARDLIAARIVEGDDVGVVVVLQILPVHLQNLLIRAKDVADVARLLAVAARHSLYPLANRRLPDGRERCLFRIECYHITLVISKTVYLPRN